MDQVASTDSEDLAARLRRIRQDRGLTTQQMSELTGIPKRTLESYMLKKGAAAPGLEALKNLCVGLKVSLDWLVFGGRELGFDQARLTRVSTRAVLKPLFEGLIAKYRRGGGDIFEHNTILGLSPEELAAETAAEAGDKARFLAENGIDRTEALSIAELAMHERDGT